MGICQGGCGSKYTEHVWLWTLTFLCLINTVLYEKFNIGQKELFKGHLLSSQSCTLKNFNKIIKHKLCQFWDLSFLLAFHVLKITVFLSFRWHFLAKLVLKVFKLIFNGHLFCLCFFINCCHKFCIFQGLFLIWHFEILSFSLSICFFHNFSSLFMLMLPFPTSPESKFLLF